MMSFIKLWLSMGWGEGRGGDDQWTDCIREDCPLLVNSLPDDKILDWSKLKHIADDILKCI